MVRDIENPSVREWLLLLLRKKLDKVSDGTATNFLVWSNYHKKFIPFTLPTGSVVPYTLFRVFRDGKFELLRVISNVIIDKQYKEVSK